MNVSLEYLRRCANETGYRIEPLEEEFITAVQRGALLPELLFPDDPKEAERIAAHPAILWKMENVRKFLARGGRR